MDLTEHLYNQWNVLILFMFSSREEPAPVSGLSGKNIVAISCGSSHSAAISAEGDLYTWGRGNYGQLGHGKSLPHIWQNRN